MGHGAEAVRKWGRTQRSIMGQSLEAITSPMFELYDGATRFAATLYDTLRY